MSQQIIDSLHATVGRKQILIDALNDQNIGLLKRVNEVEGWYQNLTQFVRDLKNGETSIENFTFNPDGTWQRDDVGRLELPAAIAERNGLAFGSDEVS